MNAREERLIHDGRRCRHPAVKRPRQDGVNLSASLIIVTVARHIDERRNETVETVETEKNPDSRTFAQAKHAYGGLINLVLVRLKQFFARIGIEYVRERFAVVTVPRETRALQDAGNLEAEKRNFARPPAIGARCEKADETPFAAQTPVNPEQFHADVIHVHAAMAESPLACLGNDQCIGFGEE